MARLRYTLEANADLNDIAAYLSRQSGERLVATRFIAERRRRCRTLATSPFSTVGRARQELGPDLRSVADKGSVIVLRQRGGTLEVVIILEGDRDMGDFDGEDW